MIKSCMTMVVKAISKANVAELEDIGLGKMILMMEVTKSDLEAIRVSLEFEENNEIKVGFGVLSMFCGGGWI